jgi:hypothetical protein
MYKKPGHLLASQLSMEEAANECGTRAFRILGQIKSGETPPFQQKSLFSQKQDGKL